MGFASGSHIFYPVAGAIVQGDASDGSKVEALKALIYALWQEDWDCDYEVAYNNPDPLVIRAFQELQPGWGVVDDD